MELVEPAPDFFPTRPANVPEDLARPSGRYRRRAWLALSGLCTFAAAYLGLTAWFGWSAWRLFQSAFAGNGGDGLDVIKGVGATVLGMFLIKGLFFRRISPAVKDFEVTPATQPRLFSFLHRIAQEVGAPKPHKVYLSPAVNACVFYDLSLLNFFFPARKNLEIGLALVNVLTLSELKAVLAHEFGHFAQRSMAVGRWVYTAQQVATQLIDHRDALDRVLSFLSRLDVRIAWIGWLLRLVVWALRSLLDTLLRLVTLAHRALSREMEFQADLVAVSASGSDALIHALSRLAAADVAWEEAKQFIIAEINAGHATEDVFAVQTRVIEHQRYILNDPNFGEVPPLPENGREKHRIFTADLAEPPQMWSTHPRNHLREENAKKTYVPAELDTRSAWEIFDHPGVLRRELSEHVLGSFEKQRKTLGETLRSLDETYSKEFYKPTYRGAYLGRSVVAYARQPSELYLPDAELNQAGALDDLYPESLTVEVERQRNLEKEKALLEALRDRALVPPDGTIRFRGRVIPRSGLKVALAAVEQELAACRQVLQTHDQRCRTLHVLLAQRISPAWGRYLRSLLHLLHYADHSLRNLSDANRKLGNTYAVVTTDRNVSRGELKRLLSDAQPVYQALAGIFADRETLLPSPGVLARMSVSSWADTMEPFRLPVPAESNLGDWLNAFSGWLNESGAALSSLRAATLEELLSVEAGLAAHARNATAPEAAPPPSRVPEDYPTLLPGEERALQKRLNWWDSFQCAAGPVAITTRFLIASAIVAGAVWITLPPQWLDFLRTVPWRDFLPAVLRLTP